ncbi:conserved hypothetical protein [Talaromyces stipitatus ATCC 10500]|uniref:SnoaL-like domain-containing protein n=1 Tax=Talaromyces stipitatus (strain ATCC 10500 / CBS 375.48 / QM 6759 / NRRL 1006) TaxID=441959 RepID=B8MA91_TALSN|nr:uncharacterized protein TSTA_123220 [Talaromyces stipitatus ATCC 10500]EED18593.1 conserved hypothetical protein [Talaromyces stipitatus ATCC 10500]
MPIPRPAILSSIHSLISAFTSNASTPTILAHFTTSPTPLVHEHGSPLFQSYLPFLGRDFIGLKAVGEYFDLLAKHLSISDAHFDDEDDWVVDPQNMTVCLRGRARFTVNDTKESWVETFIWRVTLSEDLTGESEPDDAGQGLKVQEYRVWADTGAAYLAAKGELGVLEAVSQGKGAKSVAGAAKSDGVLGGNDYPVKDKLGTGLSFGGSSGLLDENENIVLKLQFQAEV